MYPQVRERPGTMVETHTVKYILFAL